MVIPLFLFANYLHSNETDDHKNDNYKNLKCYLKVQRSSYENGKPLKVDFIVKNIGTTDIKIHLSNYWYHNFSFLIKSIQNRVVSEKPDFYYEKLVVQKKIDQQSTDNQQSNSKSKDKSKNKPVTIILKQSQMYGKSIILTNFYQLNQTGRYIIRGYFKPVPDYIRPGIKKKSNVIQIEISEAASAEDDSDRRQDEIRKTGNPYKTIEHMLDARKAKKWNQYFGYIELEKFIEQFSSHYKRYRALPPNKRQPVIDDFKEHLKVYMPEEGFSSFEDFKIYKSVIENEKKTAKVYVKMIFKGVDGFEYKRKFIYFLRHKQDNWYVYRHQIGRYSD